MRWEIEYTDEFGEWWETLSRYEQDSIAVTVGLLEQLGPNLPRPHSDTVKGSKFPNMKERRTQHDGQPYRTLYAFIPIADRLFMEHLNELQKKEEE